MLEKPLSVRYVEKGVVTGFNSKLAARTKAFAAKYPQVRNTAGVGASGRADAFAQTAKVYLWDANTAFHQVLDDPKKYGFTNITGYGKASDLWGNSFHPSSTSTSRVCSLCFLVS